MFKAIYWIRPTVLKSDDTVNASRALHTYTSKARYTYVIHMHNTFICTQCVCSKACMHARMHVCIITLCPVSKAILGHLVVVDTFTHTHAHTDTQTHTHTHKYTDTHTHTHTQTHTHTPCARFLSHRFYGFNKLVKHFNSCLLIDELNKISVCLLINGIEIA